MVIQMKYMVLCSQESGPTTPYHELTKDGLKCYTFSLQEAKSIVDDLSKQYSKFGDTFEVIQMISYRDYQKLEVEIEQLKVAQRALCETIGRFGK